MNNSVFLFFFCINLFNFINLTSGGEQPEAENLDYLEIDLGKKFGLKPNSTISNEVLRRVEKGAASGDRNNIYFIGLLRLYGIELTKNEGGALKDFKKAADMGLPEAMTAYGMCAYLGIGQEIDDPLAVRMFRKAVAGKDVNGYWMLGKMLIEGRGGQNNINYPEAVAYFQVAAESHVPQAEHHLGIMYEYGLGVEEDFEKAAVFYRRATEKLHVESMYHLALMYAYGRPGFPQDFHRAYPLFQSAAVSGHGPSMHMMGTMKAFGYGMEPDYEIAIMWYERAAGSGDERVTDDAARAARELTEFVRKAKETNDEIMDRYRALSDIDEDELNEPSELPVPDWANL